VLKETKHASFYKNEGEKENSYSLHVNVDGKSPDAPAELLEKATEALKPLIKKTPAAPVNATFLKDTEEVKAWTRKKEKELVVQLTISTKNPALMTSQLLRQVQEVNKLICSKKF
jgi:hypothetical protein